MKKNKTLLFVFLLLFSFIILLPPDVLAWDCPCTGGYGGSYTYECTYCGDDPSPTGECCMIWPEGSCGCPSWTGCPTDTCYCEVGACEPPPPPPGNGCTQPCGPCFPCAEDKDCAKIASLSQDNFFALNSEKLEFEKNSEKKNVSYWQDLPQTVSAALNEVRGGSLNNSSWKFVLENTFIYLKGVVSLFVGLLVDGLIIAFTLTFYFVLFLWKI